MAFKVSKICSRPFAIAYTAIGVPVTCGAIVLASEPDIPLDNKPAMALLAIGVLGFWIVSMFFLKLATIMYYAAMDLAGSKCVLFLPAVARDVNGEASSVGIPQPTDQTPRLTQDEALYIANQFMASDPWFKGKVGFRPASVAATIDEFRLKPKE